MMPLPTTPVQTDETPIKPTVVEAPSPNSLSPEDAALFLYDSLKKEGYSSTDKIEIIRLLRDNVKDEIDAQIRDLGKLKQSF